jgi:hypothetical protein
MHPHLTEQVAAERRRDLLQTAERYRLAQLSRTKRRWWTRQPVSRRWRSSPGRVTTPHLGTEQVSPSPAGQ